MPGPSSLTPTMIALAGPAGLSIVLTVARPRLRAEVRKSRRFAGLVGFLLVAYVAHFVEELSTELYAIFPQTFGYPAAPVSTFVGANLMALVVWVASALAVRSGHVLGLLPLWFLVSCGVLNLFLHPYLALEVGGYYPGLVTAPIMGILGVFTARELWRLTGPGGVGGAEEHREPA